MLDIRRDCSCSAPFADSCLSLIPILIHHPHAARLPPSSQDAKALKVRWNNGQQTVSPPDIFLSDSPFIPSFGAASLAFTTTLVVLTSDLGAALFGAWGGLTSFLAGLPGGQAVMAVLGALPAAVFGAAKVGAAVGAW